MEREKGGQGLKKIVDACPRRGEARDRTGAVDWNGAPRVIHGGWMRSWKGGGRESNAKRVRRDEKCTDSTFKSVAVVARFLPMARALGPMGFNPQRESSGERKKVSSGRLPLLIGRESTIHTDSPPPSLSLLSFASLVTAPPLYPMYFVNVVHPRVAFLNFVRFECSLPSLFRQRIAAVSV